MVAEGDGVSTGELDGVVPGSFLRLSTREEVATAVDVDEAVRLVSQALAHVGRSGYVAPMMNVPSPGPRGPDGAVRYRLISALHVVEVAEARNRRAE